MGRSARHRYVRPHPDWPRTENEAVSEISEINDLLDSADLSNDERSWAYVRRKKLQRYINDQEYRESVVVKMDEDGKRVVTGVEDK